ncbi:hypothetical protein [Microbacterium sp. RURRCA19A]|uniref:hypothetical protein n=1 Tax=Microbacterium sp. RURRCA19A TaxID=1907391 RepID=UPI00111586EF|nr:hypothetical protein [Microbacterium sp. RURRCA19A]
MTAEEALTAIRPARATASPRGTNRPAVKRLRSITSTTQPDAERALSGASMRRHQRNDVVMGSIGDVREHAGIVFTSEDPPFPVHLSEMTVGDGADPRAGRRTHREGIMQTIERSPELTESHEEHRDGGVSRRRDAVHDPMPAVGGDHLEAVILFAYSESDFDVAPDHLSLWTPLGGQACTRGALVEQLGIDHRSIIDDRVGRGPRRGMVMIRYDDDEPATALAAGLRGNQNDGWSALVSPDEVENVRVETTQLPLVRE